MATIRLAHTNLEASLVNFNLLS